MLYVSKVILRDVLKKEHIVGLALLILTVEKMHTLSSGIYWYNVAVRYTFMYSMMILMLVFCIKMIRSKKAWKTIVFVLLSIIFAIASGGLIIQHACWEWFFLYCSYRVYFQLL